MEAYFHFMTNKPTQLICCNINVINCIVSATFAHHAGLAFPDCNVTL